MSELTRYRNGCLPHDRVATKPLHTPTTPNAKRPSEEGSENYYVQRHAAVSRNLKALVAKAGEQSGEGSECETCPIKENATDSDPQENSRERFKLIFKNTKTKLPDLEGVLSLCSNSFESSIEQNNDVSNSWIVLDNHGDETTRDDDATGATLPAASVDDESEYYVYLRRPL